MSLAIVQGHLTSSLFSLFSLFLPAVLPAPPIHLSIYTSIQHSTEFMNDQLCAGHCANAENERYNQLHLQEVLRSVRDKQDTYKL